MPNMKSCIATRISEIGYLLLPSCDMAERLQSDVNPHNNHPTNSIVYGSKVMVKVKVFCNRYIDRYTDRQDKN